MRIEWSSVVATDLCAELGETEPEIAIGLLIERSLSGIEDQQIPIDLNLIVEELGIDEIRLDDCVGPGYLFNDGRKCWIVVNRSDSCQRQKFTAAHEITHFLLPGGGSNVNHSSIGEFRRDLEEEYLCDIGASHILIPRGEFEKVTNGKSVTPGLVKHLADQFDVSLECAIVTVCNRISAEFLVATWRPGEGGCMILERAFRSNSLNWRIWLDAGFTVSPTHSITQLSRGHRLASESTEFCLKRENCKIYLGARHLSLGGIDSRVLSVIYVRPGDAWMQSRT